MGVGEEPVDVVEMGVVDDEAPARRPVLCAAREQGLVEVVRAGLYVEHEVHGSSAEEDLQHLAERHEDSLLHRQRGQHRHRVQEAHARKHHLSRPKFAGCIVRVYVCVCVFVSQRQTKKRGVCKRAIARAEYS